MIYDQASKLKKLVESKRKNKKEIFYSKNVRVFCITSGKGGVGKTNISVNLALVLQELGKKVLLIDADLGLANIDIITGVHPKYNISHILSEGKSMREVLQVGPLGVTILPGASGLSDLADISKSDLNILLDSFAEIADNFDILIIDTGAGISKSVLNFIMSSDEVIIITTLEPSSITDAYAVIKLTHKYVDKIHIMVNRTDNCNNADFTASKLISVSQKYLGANISYLGYMLEDNSVSIANIKQTPFYLKYPDSRASKCITKVGYKLLNCEHLLSENRTTLNSWFKKIMSFIVKKPGG